MDIKVDIPSFNIEHYKRIEQYTQRVHQLYVSAIREAAQLGVTIDIAEKPFAFSDYPKTQTRAKKLFNSLGEGIFATIQTGVVAEWEMSQQKNDAIVTSVAKTSKLSSSQIARFQKRNLEALKSFQKRKVGGLGLSDRVWKYVGQFQQEIEMGIDIGLGEGRSSQQLSQDLRGYLQKPEKLFRRVRDKHGNLQLSKNARAYHPGQGVYRSSYKNAMRLARTEINMSYRSSDYERWQNMDFIIGVEIKLSNNHTLNGHPFSDICDVLKGIYPKDYVFTGWHPQCKCHAIPVFESQEEFEAGTNKILNGGTPGTGNQVTEMPANFKRWYRENKEKISRAQKRGTLPYFLREKVKSNWAYIKPEKPQVKINPPKTFKPAKTVKEAQEWAMKNNLADKVSYKGINVEVANEWNRGLFNHIQEFPELRKNIQFVGTIQEMNNTFVDICLSKFMTTSHWRVLVEKRGFENAKKYVTKELKRKVGRVPGNTFAVSCNTDGVKGISVNQKFGKDVDLFNRSLEMNVKTGFHPTGCNRIKSVVDHEMGHEIDKLLNLTTNKKVINLYNESRSVIGSELSRYAETNIQEFIAEAWAELKNNPNPRRIAKELGKIIQQLKRKR